MIPIASTFRLSKPRVAAPFAPTTLSGLQLWLDASSEAYANDDPVGTATDRSGNGRNMTASGAARPVFKSTGGPNSKPSVQHDGTQQYLSVTNFATAYTSGEMFLVMKAAAVNQGTKDWGGGTGGSNPEFYNAFGFGGCYLIFGTDTRKDALTSGITLANWHLLNEASAANDWKVRWDGANEQSTGTNTVNFGTFEGVLQLGRTRAAGSGFFSGSWSELIFYNRVLNSTERAQINAYIASKYALTIA